MTVFDELIFDRSAADLSSNSSRAYLNVSDLQRISEACQQLSLMFNQAGFSNTVTIKQSWGPFDFNDANAAQILNNVRTLRELLPLPLTTPEVPESLDSTTLETVNDIERILYDVYVALTAHLSAQP